MCAKMCVFVPGCGGADGGCEGIAGAETCVADGVLERPSSLAQGRSHAPVHSARSAPGQWNLSHVSGRTGDAMGAWSGLIPFQAQR